MSTLQERIERLNEIRQEAALYNEYSEEFMRELQQQTWQDEKDERISPTGQSRNSTRLMDKQVKGLLQIEQRVRGEDAPIDLDPSDQDETIDRERDTAQNDLERNFLYQDWFMGLFYHEHPIRCYATWCGVVGAKAVITLLTRVQGGAEVLKSVHPSSLPQPSHEHAVAFVKNDGLYIRDPEEFLTTVYAQVPGTMSASDSLLIAYADHVRVAWNRLKQEQLRHLDTDLPDDPDVRQERVEYLQKLNFEQAVTNYIETQRPIDLIASEFGISRDRFRDELRARGLARGRGGDRKGKELAAA